MALLLELGEATVAATDESEPKRRRVVAPVTRQLQAPTPPRPPTARHRDFFGRLPRDLVLCCARILAQWDFFALAGTSRALAAACALASPAAVAIDLRGAGPLPPSFVRLRPSCLHLCTTMVDAARFATLAPAMLLLRELQAAVCEPLPSMSALSALVGLGSLELTLQSRKPCPLPDLPTLQNLTLTAFAFRDIGVYTGLRAFYLRHVQDWDSEASWAAWLARAPADLESLRLPWADASKARLVAAALRFPRLAELESGNVRMAAMPSLSTLRLARHSVAYLVGVDNRATLLRLHITNYYLSSAALGELGALVRLRALTLDTCRITDVSLDAIFGRGSWDCLRELELPRNFIRRFAVLARASGLTSLDLSGCGRASPDVASLPRLPELQCLRLPANCDLSVLGDLYPGLRELGIGDQETQKSGLSRLSSLSSLERLHLHWQWTLQLSELRCLLLLPKLCSVRLSRLVSFSLGALRALADLYSASSTVAVTSEQVREWREAGLLLESVSGLVLAPNGLVQVRVT